MTGAWAGGVIVQRAELLKPESINLSILTVICILQRRGSAAAANPSMSNLFD